MIAPQNESGEEVRYGNNGFINEAGMLRFLFTIILFLATPIAMVMVIELM